jgi:hypothetical protein
MRKCPTVLRGRNGSAYDRKLRHKFRQSAVTTMPLAQTIKQRHDTISAVMHNRRVGGQLDSTAKRREFLESRMYSSGARAERQGVQVNRTYALQGLGDLEPLSGSSNFGISEETFLKYDNKHQMARYEAPPVPFTALAGRKLAEGKFWPTAPEPANLTSKEVMSLRHEKNMSPSAVKYATHIEFYIRRNLKACPQHIAERLDFAQLIIKEVLASRRSKRIYIVWTTVHPGARFELEPHIIKLGPWVQQTIMRRIKNRPNIPQVTWIYDSGALQRELPNDLKQKLESVLADNSSTLEQRVAHLKSLDKMEHQMKSIPWFMPYLWSKDKKMAQRKTVLADAAEVEARRGGGAASAAPANPRYNA